LSWRTIDMSADTHGTSLSIQALPLRLAQPDG